LLSSSILGKTYDIWLQSITFAFLQAIFRVFSHAFSKSTIVHWFVRDSRIEQIFEKSLFARIFKAILDLVVCIIGHIVKAVTSTAKGGVVEAFVNKYVRGSFFINFETIMGGFICLMFIIPHDYWSNTYALLAAVCLFALYLVMVGAGKRKLYYLHNMGLPILLFAIACVASLGFSLDRSDSFRIFLFYVTALLLLYIISADITTKERMMKLLGFIYIAVMFSAVFAFYQRLTGVAVSESLTDLSLNEGVPGRVFSTLANPNNYAEFLVIMMPIAAVFAANIKRSWIRMPFCAAIVLPIMALFMTYSRGCWISMMLTCIVFVYFANKKLIPAFFLVCVAAIPLLPDSVLIRLSTIFNSQDTSSMFRIYVWSGTLKMARDFFLTGIGLGPGSFALLYPDYANQHALVGVPHSHMVYLELVIELGLLGFVSFMWFMLRLWKDSACSLLQSSDKMIKLVLIASLSSLIGIAFAFGVEYVWYYPRTFFAYFVLAGIATAAIRIAKSEKTGKTIDGEHTT